MTRSKSRRRKRSTRAERQRKEAPEREAKDGKGIFLKYGIILVVVAIVVLAYALFGGTRPAPEEKQTQADAQEPGGEGTSAGLRIPQSEIGAQARLYSHDAQGTKVRFFAVRGSDGNSRVAFDACDVCFSANRGYRQVGTVMQCNNCGQTFAIDSIGTENIRGGCWPSYLPMSEEGDEVTLKAEDLAAKSFMFS